MHVHPVQRMHDPALHGLYPVTDHIYLCSVKRCLQLRHGLWLQEVKNQSIFELIDVSGQK